MSDVYFSYHDADRKTVTVFRKIAGYNDRLALVARDLTSQDSANVFIAALIRADEEAEERAKQRREKDKARMQEENHSFLSNDLNTDRICLCGKDVTDVIHVVLNRDHIFTPQKDNVDLCLCGGTPHNPFHKSLEYFIG